MPVADVHAFRFNPYGRLPFRLVRTLAELVAEIESAPPASLTEYIRRGDFWRWIAKVFGDRALGAVIAGSAAVVLSVRADLMLWVAAGALTVSMLTPERTPPSYVKEAL